MQRQPGTLRVLLAAAAAAAAAATTPGARNCSTHWIRQRIDHYAFAVPAGAPAAEPGPLHYMQRYLLHTSFFRNDSTGSIFFYVGNEGDVTLYADHTGLMWEHAEAAGALIVFAEHRYYGASWPFGNASHSYAHPAQLSSHQALQDYAVLLRTLRAELGISDDVPAIAFGGSYGGVLAALFRAGWPGSVAGAVASSAPLRAFPGQTPPWDSALYYAVVTRDATPEGGSPAACAPNVRAALRALLEDGATTAGRALLGGRFRTCAPVATADDALALAFAVRGAFDGMAMGNYPYPTNYLTGGGDVYLPAFPVRVACSHLATPIDASDHGALYAAVAAAIAVAAGNATPPAACLDVPPNPYSHPALPYDGIWDYQQCTEEMPDSQWFTSTGVSDMFFASPANATFLGEHCELAWRVQPAQAFVTTRFALPRFTGASNIAFTNGLLDPWSGASLQTSPAPARDLVVFNVSDGAHHLDLFFSNPADPPSVTAVRGEVMALVRKWIAAARAPPRGRDL